MSEPQPAEGFIDIRFVLGPDDGVGPAILRVDRMGYLLPVDVSAEDVKQLADYFWEYPHELAGDVVDAFNLPSRKESDV